MQLDHWYFAPDRRHSLSLAERLLEHHRALVDHVAQFWGRWERRRALGS